MDYVSLYDFRKCVRRYHGDRKMISFSTWDQFLCLAFAQLTFRESLRDIEVCLRSMSNRLYHCGFRGRISRSTLADANERRDWRIFADFAQGLIRQARDLYHDESFGVELQETVYAFDSTTIDLCLALFPWAPFQQSKAAIKLHTLLDLRGSIPTFIHITHGRVNDVRALDEILPEAGSFYILDRGYTSFDRLYRLHQGQAYFIVRARSHQHYHRKYSHLTDRARGIRCDQTIVLAGRETQINYPERLRRVRFVDPNKGLDLNLFTNNFVLSAPMVADLYHSRWKIELFFRWIKQHLKIKAFYGTSENAVKTQVWVAIAVYVLVAIVKKKLHLDISLYTILQILIVNPFDQQPLNQLLTNNQATFLETDLSNQLKLII